MDHAIRLDKRVPEVHFLKGECYRAQRWAPEAAAAYGEAARLRPDFFEARMNWGLMLRAAGESERAIRAFKKAKSVSPKFAEAKNQLGLSLIECGDYINGLKEIGAAAGFIEFRTKYDARFSLVG